VDLPSRGGVRNFGDLAKKEHNWDALPLRSLIHNLTTIGMTKGDRRGKPGKKRARGRGGKGFKKGIVPSHKKCHCRDKKKKEPHAITGTGHEKLGEVH